MFLHQKLGYKATFITEDFFYEVEDKFNELKPVLTGFDTETDSLDFMLGYPFLMTFGFEGYVWAFEPTKPLLTRVYALMAQAQRNYASKCQYDFHMLTNFGYPIPENVPLAENLAVARLTKYADDTTYRIGLEALGTEYVDETSKFAGKVIKERIHEQNRAAKTYLKDLFIKKYPKETFGQWFEAWQNKVQFVEYDEKTTEIFEFMGSNYAEANYQTVYMEYPELMINYAMDDVVIMLEYLKVALPVLKTTDPKEVTFNRENDLIRPICEMERVGFKANVPYLLESRAKMMEYKTLRYARLTELLGQEISVGQHKVIIELFRSKWKIELAKADESCLEDIYLLKCTHEPKEAAEIIIELRTVDKWISTYIDGKLNAVVNGRLYTSINNQGAVSGRVSCNLQQQPKDAFTTKDGEELFHPRKVFMADEGKKLFFLDFSQMELRLQAYYTMLVGKGDTNMCRAYIPFECTSDITGEEYTPKDPEHFARWDSGEWVLKENGKPWTPTDLHNVTTFNAFPELNNDVNHPDFKKRRKQGKMCNFLKNYQGGVKAIMEQMKVDPITAGRLDRAYYDSFPGVRNYQQWVNAELIKYGFVENLYGRRYYMHDAGQFYKAGNYLIQGGCADMVKIKEIEVTKFLRGFETQFVLPIHDELVFSVPEHEEHLIPKLQATLQDVTDVMPWIPMISEIEVSSTNWAEKKGWTPHE